MSKTTVVHHSADYDGIFCREIARKFLPDAELIGWDFSDKPLEQRDDWGTLYVMDLPLDKIFGRDFSKDSVQYTENAFDHIVWIDHHKSSIESHPSTVAGYRIDGVAACRLAWQWFSASPRIRFEYAADLPSKQDFIDRKVSEPLAVRLAGEYDIWDKRDERVDTFQFGLRSQELCDAAWFHLLSDDSETPVTTLLNQGQRLQSYQQSNDAGMMHRSFIVEWEGLKFLALTTARCNSLTFAAKDVLETGHDALMAFYYNGKDWNFSLYHASHRKDLDLSKIAVKYGGGGHRGACGFRIERIPFLP